MKIIVGLGNPGKKYENTRHNVGFLALSQIAMFANNSNLVSEKLDFKLEKKFESEIAKTKIGNEDIVLVKPQTFMNNSGEAVKKTADFYKINPESDLIVIYDDVDISFNKVKIRAEGSSAGHKGLQSIIDRLGTNRFMRIRIGIGRPENDSVKIEDWVLQEFSGNERKELSATIQDLITNGVSYLLH